MSKAGGVTILAILLVVALLLLVQSGIPWVRSEHVILESGDVRLAATLSLPRWQEGPFPAAVIVHGSGATHRRDLRGYLRKLLPRGMAVLRYDKRGVGDSTGTYGTITVAESQEMLGLLAGDAVTAVNWLAQHPEIDATRLGLVGGSQAGWVMPLAASRTDAVRFVVCVSGPAVTYGEEIRFSRLTGDDPGFFQDLSEAEIERQMDAFEGPHGYDPAAALAAMTVPSLWILGARDRSVPTARIVNALRGLQERSPGLFDFHVFPQGDHGIRDADTGRRIDYWPRVYSWLTQRGVTP
jgi:dienelactone hydrolase